MRQAAALHPDWGGSHLLWAGAVLLGIYVLFILVFDRCLSTRASWRLLLQTLEQLANCRGLPVPADGHVDKERFDKIEERVNRTVDDARADLGCKCDRSHSCNGPLFINATVVLSQWRTAHDLDRLCWSLVSKDEALQHLSSLRTKLAGARDPEATEMARRIEKYEQAPSDDNPWPLLDEALSLNYDIRDTLYESLANRQTTGSWMAMLGAALVVIAAIALHHEYLFVFGALGGFLSRTQRLLSRRPGRQDYGVSAVLFILAPIVGALSGWAGIALIQGLVQLKMLSSTTFGTLWTGAPTPGAYVLAFAFGFVERLADRAVALAAAALPTNKSSMPTTATDPQRAN